MSTFRILSLDGGGLKGVFSAALLAELEAITGKRIVEHFDLIAGTSTGGIIALGLGLGLTPSRIVDFYVEHGPRIFPRPGKVHRFLSKGTGLLRVAYSPKPLEQALRSVLGDKHLGESACRLLIPAFDPVRGDVHIFKTAHHARLRTDYRTLAWEVGMATAAAPTYFPAFVMSGGIELIDGGVWANNPAMVALTEALAILDQPAHSIHMLSIGTTGVPYWADKKLRRDGGLFAWRRSVIDLLMHGQSLAATNQARHILGQDRFLRVNPFTGPGRYSLDDATTLDELVSFGRAEARGVVDTIHSRFLGSKADPFQPVYRLDDGNDK